MGHSTMPIDNMVKSRLRKQLATGEVVLFTGAGFSHEAVSVSGKPVIGVDELKGELARLAFGSSDAGLDSSLADLFDVAISRNQKNVGFLFEARLRVDSKQTPKRFDKWFSLPWKRHYTLNIDDLDDVVQSRAGLPRSITSVSASVHRTPQTTNLLSIHLNGRLKDFPNVTFSVRQYARRAGLPDPWYEHLTSDLLTSPVLFVGTVLEEPGLWQHVELRSSRNPGEVELRPPSYLVSPKLPAARAALLKKFNVTWVRATEEEFYQEVLAPATAEAQSGYQAIMRQHQPTSAARSFHTISDCRAQEPRLNLELYLQGREPTWADIAPGGFAVERDFEKSLHLEALTGRHKLLLLTGTAASGKSTTAMRLAASMESAGRRTFSYDIARGSLSASQVLKAAKHLEPEVLLLDDVDIFGESAGRLLRDLVELPTVTKVIATVRNSRMQALSLEDDLVGIPWIEQTIPFLEDGDIDLLIASLERAGRLGQMAGMNTTARRKLFGEQAGRQLLVAMYYATSGEQLEDKVHSECEDLSGASRVAYGMAALATIDHQQVQQSELLLGLNSLGFASEGNQLLNDIEKLKQRALLIAVPGGLQVRHRWIADRSVDFFTDNGLIHKLLMGLTFALACNVDFQMSPHTRERRMIRRLINHDRLQRLVSDTDYCREVYAFLQDRLGWDYHYWLQRGSLEVECGDLSQARSYLNSARSLVDGVDYNVETEYAYLLLKLASDQPSSGAAVVDAARGFAILEEIMRVRGADDSYAYHVYGSQGLRWARRAPISAMDKGVLLNRLVVAVREGLARHPRVPDLVQLEKDLERECLLLAT